MAKNYNYKTQKVSSRNSDGKIKSIKPIYNEQQDPYLRVHQQSELLKEFSDTFPETKMQIEVNSIPDSTYKTLKEDFDYRPGFHDGAGKFFYSPTPSSVLIVHKEI